VKVSARLSMAESEEVTLSTVKGHLGSVSFDGQTIVIEKKLRGATRIPVAAVQAVTIERAGIGMRAIRFSVAGGSLAHRQQALGNHKDAAQDPNALTFKKGSLHEFELFVAAVESARQAGHGMQAAATPLSGAGDLERLAELHRSGALSDAEFSAAKAKALGL
jgi:Domain of unknown function (DUF4429)/Short C-terminal domain